MSWRVGQENSNFILVSSSLLFRIVSIMRNIGQIPVPAAIKMACEKVLGLYSNTCPNGPRARISSPSISLSSFGVNYKIQKMQSHIATENCKLYFSNHLSSIFSFLSCIDFYQNIKIAMFLVNPQNTVLS